MKRIKNKLFIIAFVLILNSNIMFAAEVDNMIGISRTNKTLVNAENMRYVLIENERVRIGSINGDQIVILDPEGNIFTTDKNDLDILKQGSNYNNLLENNTVNRNSVINSAFYKAGSPYVYGAVGPNSFDCSGYTYQIFKNELGIDINRVADAQFKNGVEVSRENLLPGDLVFFGTSSEDIGHVGIYIGNDDMIHASSGANKVVVSSLNSTWYKERYVGARRLIY